MSRAVRYSVLCLLSVHALVCIGQDVQCGFDRLSETWTSQDFESFEDRMISRRDDVFPRTDIVIPVVFHVVYLTNKENITDLQIRSQIEILNRDFANRSDNISRVPAEFAALGADTGIRFCIASRDPLGNPTNGITRTKTIVPLIGTHQQTNGRSSVHYSQYGGRDGWDPERYINVWIAGMDRLLGSASFPGMAPYAAEDGIIIDPAFVGAIGSAAQSDPFDRGHTLTHEMGHYLSLYHVWGAGNGGCDTDDFVDDTPLQDSYYLGCPEYPQYSCGSSDMYMNFMDFTNDRCLALFTHGQIARMHNALSEFRPTLLLQSENCSIPNGGKIRLDNAILYFAPSTEQIILLLDEASEMPSDVRLFSIDGRLLFHSVWDNGSVYWINVEDLIDGVYVVQLMSEGESKSRKVIVTR